MTKTENKHVTDLVPKQARSQESLRKLLNALERLLKEKYFEHIKVAELCDTAGVSVGNFYRRFKSKESLLPVLYETHRANYMEWFDNIVKQNREPNLNDRIEKLVIEALDYFNKNKHILRTLNLYARLYPSIVEEKGAGDIYPYENLYESWREFLPNSDEQELKKIFDYWGYVFFTMISERVIYAEVPPTSRSKISDQEFINYTTRILLSFLN